LFPSETDADAMGASLALSYFLKQFGHSITIISPTNWAGWLNWMPGCKEVIDYDLFKEKAEKILDQAEWVFCLDFNAITSYKEPGTKLEQLLVQEF
jgi:phosphoesterase RecJ-like protein